MKSHSPKKMQPLNPVISPDLCLSQQPMKTCRTLLLHQPPQYCRTGFSPIRIPTAHKAPPWVLPSRLRGCTMAGGIDGNVRGNLPPLTQLFTTSHCQSIMVSPKTNFFFIGYVSSYSRYEPRLLFLPVTLRRRIARLHKPDGDPIRRTSFRHAIRNMQLCGIDFFRSSRTCTGFSRIPRRGRKYYEITQVYRPYLVHTFY